MPAPPFSVITLPAVLWEPAFSEGDPSFPSPITFDQSGGPTRITLENAAPVPVVPGLALDNLVNNFNTQLGLSPPTAHITLPFAIAATATLTRASTSNPRGASVDYNRPKFPTESVEGGYQIRVQAIDPSSAGTPGFPGSAEQLKVGRSGPLTGLSVLDSGGVDQIFNNYLGPLGKNPQVPGETAVGRLPPTTCLWRIAALAQNRAFWGSCQNAKMGDVVVLLVHLMVTGGRRLEA